MRPINEIIVHCSATKTNWAHDKSTEWKRDEIRRWHVQGNGWSDIGYHFVIDRDGAVVTGRPIERTGAHVKGRNTGTIGICLIGGHGSQADDLFSDHFTIAQDRALRRKIRDLASLYGGDIRISGHNIYAQKACPGFSVPKWWARKKPEQKPAKHWLTSLVEIFTGIWK